jgi:hypothetical protein
MMDLCLTRSEGTPSLGVYRGLKIKTRHSRWDVEVVRCPLEDLLRNMEGPVLMRIRLEGEPAVGRQRWATSELKRRWRGEGLRLVPRGR